MYEDGLKSSYSDVIFTVDIFTNGIQALHTHGRSVLTTRRVY